MKEVLPLLTFSMTEFEALFREIFEKNGLEQFCERETVSLFAKFTEILLDANERFNLTAIKQLPDVIAKHYADCLLAAEYFPVGASVLDVGCGGGFPTFPLSMARPDLRITALDSTQKKVDFVAMAAKELGLGNVTAICARAESPELRSLRQGFDVVTSRAMARLSVLSELTLPFVKLGGTLVALKGAQGNEELAEAQNGLSVLGGELEKAVPCTLATQSDEESRVLILISKKHPTPAINPRPYATILKKPLGKR